MIVVPVLITSCHVSENPNAGPEAAHTKTTMQQIMKATACPAAWETVSAIWVNHLFKFIVGLLSETRPHAARAGSANCYWRFESPRPLQFPPITEMRTALGGAVAFISGPICASLERPAGEGPVGPLLLLEGPRIA